MPTYASARVVLDACVLYPPTLRDTLLRLAEAGLLQPYWSEAILDEVARNLRTAGPTEAQVQHLLGQLRRAFPEACVEGYEGRLAEARNHPKDRHVVAAVLHAGCSVVVTDNLKDFRPEDMPEGVESQSADDFLMGLLERSPRQVLDVLEAQAAGYRRKTTRRELLVRLGLRAPRFAIAVDAATRVRTDAEVAELERRLDACYQRMYVYNRDPSAPPLGPAFFEELDTVLTALKQESPAFERALLKHRATLGPQLIREAFAWARSDPFPGARDAGRDILQRAGFNPDDTGIATLSDEELMAVVDRNQSSHH